MHAIATPSAILEIMFRLNTPILPAISAESKKLAQQEMENFMGKKRTSAPPFDLRQFGEYRQERIAKDTLALFWRIIRQPGGRDKLDAKINELRQETEVAE